MPDYIPRVLSQLISWFVNFASKIAVHGPTLGVTAAEITAAANDSTTVQHVINGQQIRQTDAQEFTRFRDECLYGNESGSPPIPPTAGTITPGLPGPGAVPFNIIPRTRDLAQRMKSHPLYTTAIGEDLGIEAAAAGPVDAQPALRTTVLTDFQIQLNFPMRGFRMIEIQAKRTGDADFITIGFDSSEPYLDSRAPVTPGQPEVRQYRARYHDAGGPIGSWSDIVPATAQP